MVRRFNQLPTHVFLHCPNFYCEKQTFFQKVNTINFDISQNEVSRTKDLLFGSEKLESDKYPYNCLQFIL